MPAPAPAKNAQKTDIMDQLFERIKATKGEVQPIPEHQGLTFI